MPATREQSDVGTAARQLFAWHGWKLTLPKKWNPVKIEGDFAKGHVLFADLHRPRMGLRWRTASKRFDAARAMRDEVGALAAESAVPHANGLLFTEPEPPGRDVFMMRSETSNRAVEIVYHARRREHVLADSIIPTLDDALITGEIDWAVFDLSCRVPARLRLVDHHLNAGDLRLSFSARRESLSIRQVSLAQIALRKMPIDKWLAAMATKHHDVVGDTQRIDGRIFATLRRKTRFAWKLDIAKEMFVIAMHDHARDRLILIRGTDRAMIESALASMEFA